LGTAGPAVIEALSTARAGRDRGGEHAPAWPRSRRARTAGPPAVAALRLRSAVPVHESAL